MATMYRITTWDSIANRWDETLIGHFPEDNVFTSIAEADAGIEALMELGDDWADAEYKVEEIPPLS